MSMTYTDDTDWLLEVQADADQTITSAGPFEHDDDELLLPPKTISQEQMWGEPLRPKGDDEE